MGNSGSPGLAASGFGGSGDVLFGWGVQGQG